MRYFYRTAILENVVQSQRQALREGEVGTQKAGELFSRFMNEIGDEGWEIIAVNRIDEDVFMYTLRKPRLD